MTLEWLIPDQAFQGSTFYWLSNACRTGKHPLTKSRLHSMGAAQCRYICINERCAAVLKYVPDGDIGLAAAGPDNPSEAELKRRER